MRIPTVDLSSPQVRDAARLAIQSAVAAAAMYSLMQALGLPEKFVGVLSAVLVVQPTVGNTLSEGWQRFIATVIGCVIGVLCLALLPSGYGTAVALAVSTLMMHLAAAIRSEWRYGVVAAVALSLGSENEALRTAFDRSIAIGLGVALGAVVTLIIWPDRAERRAERLLRAALEAAARRLHLAVQATQQGGRADSAEERASFHRNYQRAREAFESVRFADTETLERKVDAVENFYNSVLFLNRVAEERDQPVVTDEGLEDQVETIRNCGCEIALGLAQSAAESDERQEQLGRLREALKEIRQQVIRQSEDAENHILVNALAFGLDEVEDSLTTLVELYDER